MLPEVTFLERYDELVAGWGRRGWVALRQPVMPAPQEQKPGWWIAKQLAEKLGIPESMPFKDIEEYLAYRVEKSGLDCADAPAAMPSARMTTPRVRAMLRFMVSPQFFAVAGKAK